MYRVAPYKSQVVRRNDGLFNLFDEFFNDVPTDKVYTTKFNVDIQNNDENYVFEADLPGIVKEDISIDYKDEKLIIKVESKKEEEEKTDQYIRRERSRQSMKRAFFVKDIAGDSITAKLENGVLTIVAPKLIEDNNNFTIDIQ